MWSGRYPQKTKKLHDRRGSAARISPPTTSSTSSPPKKPTPTLSTTAPSWATCSSTCFCWRRHHRHPNPCHPLPDLKRPAPYTRLVRGVRAAYHPPSDPVPYAPAGQLSFLEAVVRETIRLYPAIGMWLGRYVPGGGWSCLRGRVCAGGHGINAYVVGRNKGVLGKNADEFRLGRWLKEEGEGEEEYEGRSRRMNAADLGFGGGPRNFLGRNLALVEGYEVVATLVNRYEIELEEPKREWKVVTIWVMRQTGLVTKIRSRK